MPIIDIEVVMPEGAKWPEGCARALADALGGVFSAPAGRVWLRMRRLAAADYAENGVGQAPHPVFVAVLHADGQEADARAAEAAAIARAVGEGLGRDAQQVHVQYAPPGRGRIAFGGRLLR